MIVERNVRNCNSKVSIKKVQLSCESNGVLFLTTAEKRTGATEFFWTSSSSTSFHVQKQNNKTTHITSLEQSTNARFKVTCLRL